MDYSLRDLLTVEVVDFQQVLEDIFQVVEVDEASAVSHSLIDLHKVVDGSDVLVMEHFINVHVGVVELPLELLVRVGKQVVDVYVLLVVIFLLADHPSNALVNQQLLVHLQVFQVLGQVANNLVNERLSIAVVHFNKHLFGQLCDLQVGLTRHVLHSWVALVHELV